MIRQDRLEEQLIAGLTERVLQPEMIDYTVQQFRSKVEERLQQIREEGGSERCVGPPA
jgi:hypothetical protein